MPAALDVQLTVTATSRKASSALTPTPTPPFEVVKDAVTQPLGSAAFVSKDGPGEACAATAEVQTCVDVLLPNGAASAVFFSTGVCKPATATEAGSGCPTGPTSVLQVLADLDTGEADAETPLYTPSDPATLIVKCDVSLCGGGGVPSKVLQVNLAATGPLLASPACGSKGFMDGPLGHCVDYVQSKRVGSGDTWLYLLIVDDARMSCC